MRAGSHLSASTSSNSTLTRIGFVKRLDHELRQFPGSQRYNERDRQRAGVALRALFEPPPFQPSKLNVSFASGASPIAPAPPQTRRYTLTHNDLTGELWLTVGGDYNSSQISGFYTRLLRDEVTAEWRYDRGAEPPEPPSLHIFCHVSGQERWLAPPLLRNYIFRREIPLVLDCVAYAEQELVKLQPQLAQAKVFIHFESQLQELHCTEFWGIFGDRGTWKPVPISIVKRFLFGILQIPLDEYLPAVLPDAQSSEMYMYEEQRTHKNLHQEQLKYENLSVSSAVEAALDVSSTLESTPLDMYGLLEPMELLQGMGQGQGRVSGRGELPSNSNGSHSFDSISLGPEAADPFSEANGSSSCSSLDARTIASVGDQATVALPVLSRAQNMIAGLSSRQKK